MPPSAQGSPEKGRRAAGGPGPGLIPRRKPTRRLVREASSPRCLPVRPRPRSLAPTPGRAAAPARRPPRYLGHIKIDIPTKRIVSSRPLLLGGANSSSPVPPDPALLRAIAGMAGPVKKLEGRVVGALVALGGRRTGGRGRLRLGALHRAARGARSSAARAARRLPTPSAAPLFTPGLGPPLTLSNPRPSTRDPPHAQASPTSSCWAATTRARARPT
jgi:hypothetical protein